ncbi:hypothetical protein MSG28_008293 [Choristoneura fumiferana]|uniref:Uncharacterized protein n=1 Tax=Choristoneura fumiferana TaxID=7141 RepID=A0ACC0JB10_CHOFU|nr:hypothetical protein MSG28_008293 [Choristoneura fumiferana]
MVANGITERKRSMDKVPASATLDEAMLATVSKDTDKRCILGVPRVNQGNTEQEAMRVASSVSLGLYNILHMLLSGLILMGVIMQTLSLGYVIPAAQCDLNVGLENKGWLAALPFTGPSAVVYTYLGEFNNLHHRDKMVAFGASFVGIGTVLLPGVSWLILPLDFAWPIPWLGIDYRPWRFLVIACAIPYAIGTILMFFAPESPKFHYAKGRTEECLETLKKIYAANKWTTPDHFPGIGAVLSSMWDQTAPLFRKPLLKWTALTCFVQFGIFATCNGFYVWFPTILNSLANHDGVESRICDILDAGARSASNATERSIYIGLVFCSMYIVVGFLVDLVGKKAILIVILGGSGLCGIGAHLAGSQQTAVVLFAVFQMSGACIGMMNAVAVELFPTRIRAMAVCLSMMMGRLGSVVGSNLIGVFMRTNCGVSFYLFGGLLLGLTCLLILAMYLDIFGFSVVLPAAACDLGLTTSQQGLLSAVPLIASANAAAFVLVGETTPRRHRSRFMFLMASATMLVQFFICVFAIPVFKLTFRYSISWLSMDYRPWRLLMQIISLPGIIGVVGMLFLYESPKFLLSRDRDGQALTLDTVYLEEPLQLVNSGASFLRKMWDQTAPLFKPPLLKNNLKLYYILLCAYMTGMATCLSVVVARGFGFFSVQLIAQLLTNHCTPMIIGCGFIGRNLVEYLISNDLVSGIRAVDKTPPQLAFLNPAHSKIFEDPRVEYKSANLINPTSCASALDPGDSPWALVLNCAGETRIGQTEAVYAEGICTLSSNVAKLCDQQGVRLVEISSGQMYSTEKTRRRRSTLKECTLSSNVSKQCGQQGVGLVEISSGQMYSTAPRLLLGAIYKHLNETMKLLWTADLKMNTVHVSDVCRAMWTLGNRPDANRQVYNVVDEGNSTQGSLAELNDIASVAEEANDKHLSAWASICRAYSLTHTPLEPGAGAELLLNKHLCLDGSKYYAVLEDYASMNLFPKELLL